MNGLAFGNAEPSIRACMEAKIPTILLDDFPRDYYYEGFEKSGVLCAAGVGMTPGVTDMLACWGVNRCDSVLEIHVSWAFFRPIASSPGLVLTTFGEMDPAEKDRAFFENGKMFPQPPLKESKLVEFAQPYGQLPVYYVPPPETIRLSQFVPGIKKVVTMGTWLPIEMELLKQLIDFGVFDKKEIFHIYELFHFNIFIGRAHIPGKRSINTRGYCQISGILILPDPIKGSGPTSRRAVSW
jgi:saccharopine dehydrogenase-like NADP-dependent oxidoreductase